MKIRLPIFIFLILLLLAIPACQTNRSAPGETSAPNAGEDDQVDVESAYPSGETGQESYPVQEFIPIFNGDDAYPINEEDLQLLLRTWSRSAYSENGLLMDPGVKTLRFNADGSYEVITEEGTKTGRWTAGLTAVEASLILDPGTDEVLTFEIVNLEEALLNLRSLRDDISIEEEYLPAE